MVRQNGLQFLSTHQNSPTLVAVSGGSDSVALLLLMQSEAQKTGSRLIAATVDHKLRPDSLKEALFVSDLCRNLNIEHHILSWEDDKPVTGLLHAARLARYRLLAELAQKQEAAVVMIGHTRNDQAETILMRRKRGCGLGMAGIASGTLFKGRIWFYRPVLSLYRQDLCSYLIKRGVSWIEDPSNLDLRRERNQLRAKLSASHNMLDQINRACRVACCISQKRVALGKNITKIISKYVCYSAPGLIQLSPEVLYVADRENVIYLLRVLLAVSGGSSYLPDRVRSEGLFQNLLDGKKRITLSRTLIDSRKNGIFLLRENRDLPALPAAAVGTVWDRRFCVVDSQQKIFSPLSDLKSAPASLCAAAQKSQPLDWVNKRVFFSPVVSPWADFLPDFDFLPAQAIASLLGAQSFPNLPCHGHIDLQS